MRTFSSNHQCCLIARRAIHKKLLTFKFSNLIQYSERQEGKNALELKLIVTNAAYTASILLIQNFSENKAEIHRLLFTNSNSHLLILSLSNKSNSKSGCFYLCGSLWNTGWNLLKSRMQLTRPFQSKTFLKIRIWKRSISQKENIFIKNKENSN